MLVGIAGFLGGERVKTAPYRCSGSAYGDDVNRKNIPVVEQMGEFGDTGLQHYGRTEGGKMSARWLGVPLALLIAMAAGCGGAPSTHVPAKSPVAGTFVIAGGPVPGSSQPTSGVVTFTDSGGKRTEVTVGPSGKFKLQLPEGSYSLSGHSPQFGDGSYLCPGGTIQVRTKSPGFAQVVCPVP
jgi:hypothetical protein